MNYDTLSEACQVMIFITTIETPLDSLRVGRVLDKHQHVQKWSIDLDDWEKVLKIEADSELNLAEARQLIIEMGYVCEEMDH